MKKALSLALSFIMVIASLTALPFTALAGDVINVTNEQELTQALNKDSVVDEINITQSFTIGSDCAIKYDNSHINYYSDTVLTVANGVTLTVGTNGVLGSMWPSFEGDWNTPPTPNGKVINNGTINVANGGKIEADFDTNNGYVVIQNGGEAVVCNTNNGTVNVEDGGIYATTQGNKAVNNGTVNVYNGGMLESRFGCTIENTAEGVINLYGTFRCGCINFGSDDFWFDNKGTVDGNGDIILYPATELSSMDSLIEKLMGELGQTSRFENWDDANIFKEVNVSSYAELEAAMGAQRTVAGENVEGNMDTIIIQTADITVPAGADLGSMTKLIVPDGAALTIESGASLSCGIENNGSVTVKSGGELATTMGGSIENRNTLTVEDGAKLTSQMGGEVINESGASLTLDGDFYCGCYGMGGNDVAWFENKGNVSGNGGIILYQADGETAPVNSMDGLIESVMDKLGQTSRFENWDDINIYKQVEVSDYAQLEAAMTAQRTVAGENVEGNMDTIIIQTADITVPAGADLGSMTKLIVPDGAALTIESGASLSCGIENNGSVTVKSGGELATTMGGSIENRNTLTVEDGAKLTSQMGGEVINESGASLTLDGDFYCGCYGMGGNDVAWFENKGNVSGNGGIILYQADDETAPVSDMTALIESINQQIAGGGTVPSTNAHTEHVWELTEVVTPATCTVAGGGEYTCKECGVSKLDIIPVNNNHKSDKGTVTKKATLSATGVRTFKCTACSKVVKTEVIPKNNFTSKGKTVAVKKATVKKKNVAVKRAKAITVKNAKGKLSYKKAKGDKKIVVAKNGNITVKKGLKKGTYKVTVKVTAAGNAEYAKAVKTVTVKIVIK